MISFTEVVGVYGCIGRRVSVYVDLEGTYFLFLRFIESFLII